MYKVRLPLLFALSLSAFLMFQACDNNDDEPAIKEFIAENSSFTGFGNFPVTATRNGADPALGGMAHGGNDETVVRNIFTKGNQERVNGKYPVGTIIVKQSTKPGDSMNEITAMVKRGNNFNPNAGDWEFFMLEPNGNIGENGQMRGANLMDGMCAGCHNAASAKDFVFTSK